jgi:hypothetical protein
MQLADVLAAQHLVVVTDGVVEVAEHMGEEELIGGVEQSQRGYC